MSTELLVHSGQVGSVPTCHGKAGSEFSSHPLLPNSSYPTCVLEYSNYYNNAGLVNNLHILKIFFNKPLVLS